jgi:hypothetical protein
MGQPEALMAKCLHGLRASLDFVMNETERGYSLVRAAEATAMDGCCDVVDLNRPLATD